MFLVILTVFFGFLTLEWLLPNFKNPLSTNSEKVRRLARNLSLGASYRVFFAPWIFAPAFLYLSKHPLWIREAGYPGLCFDILLLDLVNYGTHRLGHVIPFFWRFHAVHHLDNRLDVTTGFRVHVFEKVLFLPFKLTAFYLAAIPLSHVALFETFTLCLAIFHHSNVRIPQTLEKWISRVVTTPSFHSVHHHAYVPYTDSNYGFVFTFWDRLLGTRSCDSLGAKFIAGVNGRHEGKVPETIGELLLQPFQGPIAGTTSAPHLPTYLPSHLPNHLNNKKETTYVYSLS